MTHRGQSHAALVALLALTFTTASAAADNAGARGHKSEAPGKSEASAKSAAPGKPEPSARKAASPEGAKARGASAARGAPDKAARESREAETLSKGDSKKKVNVQELKQSRKERSQRQRSALKERWGARLSEPAIQAELRHHARRMAQLERMALLAESERQGADKDKLLARIEKLSRLESERHERKMKKLEEPASTKLVKE